MAQPAHVPRPASQAGTPLIELRGVSFRPGGRLVLDSLDLVWRDASICLLIGPNGAGKTLTLRIAHGLLRPDAGSVRFEGHEPPAGDAAFEGQALVFQQPSMFRGTTLDNLMLARFAARQSPGEFRHHALAMLERVGLAALANAPALKLSGGERQRVAIARAWLTGPRLLMLDEPTASLDPEARDSIEALIRDIAASGCRVLMSSHNLGQVARLADEVVFLSAGRLIERTPAADFFSRPRSDEAQRFLQGELPWLMQTRSIDATATDSTPNGTAPSDSASCDPVPSNPTARYQPAGQPAPAS